LLSLLHFSALFHASFFLTYIFVFLHLFTVPVVGNFTDEELLNVPPSNGVSVPNTSEYPLQRDEVGRAVSSGGERSQHTKQGKSMDWWFKFSLLTITSLISNASQFLLQLGCNGHRPDSVDICIGKISHFIRKISNRNKSQVKYQ